MRTKARKLIWSVPLVAVLAVVGALAAFAALGINPAQAHDIPGAVLDLTAKADGTNAVDLKWKAPTTGGTPTSYRIDTSGDGQTWSSIMADTDSTATTYRDEMVSNVLGDDRFYRVFALNSAGAGPVSRTAGPVNVPSAGAPGNVTGITASPMGRKAIKLMWSEPASTGGTDAITKYVIAGGIMGDGNSGEVNIPSVTTPLPATDDTDISDLNVSIMTQDATTSYTLEGLMPSQTWYFRVYAYNGEKVSAGSSETRSATTDALGKIGPATKVTAVEDPESGEVTLYWYWPDDDGGRMITHWKIERKQTALSKLDQDPNNDGVQPQQNNQPGVQLNRWQAIVDDDTSVATATTNAYDYMIGADADMTVGTTADVDVLVPGAKYQYRVTARTGNAATPTDNPAGTSIEGTASAASNTLTVKGPLDFTGVTGATCDGLTALAAAAAAAAKAEYNRVKGICDTSQARIVDDELSADRDGKGNVEVTLTRGSPLKATSFRIDVAVVEGTQNKWMEVRNYIGNLGNDGEFVSEYEDPTTGGNLEYRVFAYVGSAQLLPSNPMPEMAGLKEVMMPGKVENLKASPISQTQIDVTWSAPEKDGDAVVDMYCVQVRTNATGDGFDTLATDADHAADTIDVVDTAKSLCMGTDVSAPDKFALTDMMMYSHKKLMAGQTYYYKVYAINNPVYRGDNRSTSSDSVSATTKKQDKPMMPTDLVAETATDSNYGGRVNKGVYLLWNAPPKPAGGMIDSYVVQRKVDDGSWANVHSDSDTGSMRTILHDTSEPAEGEMRAYRVAAKNASGTGAWSDMAYYPVMMHTHNKVPTPVGRITDMMVRADQMSTPLNVSMYFKDADTDDTLTYSATSSMTDYATVEIGGDDMNMLTITGVAVGEATIMVTATDPAGAMAKQTFVVTVEAATMELGAAMDLTAMANADGSITLMFTPGTSATHHFVFGSDDSEWDYADGMDMHTVPADQLTSGMEYKFYVFSGQWEEMADGKWEGRWAAEGWSNAATSTAN